MKPICDCKEDTEHIWCRGNPREVECKSFARLKQGTYMTTHMYLGRSVEDIAAALEYWDNSRKQGPQMTRSEAIKKVTTREPNASVDSVERFIDRLEALGLITFDEEKKELTEVIYRARLVSRDTSISQKQFIDYLAANGYKIIKEQSK